MARTLTFETEVLLGPEEVVMEMDDARFSAWALEVTLLLSGLNDSLVVRSAEATTLVLSLLEERQGRVASRAVVTRVGSTRLTCAIPRAQAIYLQAALLRAYRDKLADVSQIHLEGDLGEAPFDLTFFFKASRAPMSAEEAARMRGRRG